MKFKDFCTFKEGYVNPSQKIASYFDGPIKWLRATDLNNSYVYNTSRTLTEEGFKSAGKSSILFKPDTIAISKSGTIGRIGILKDYMCGNRAIINIEVNQEKMNLRYVFYWLLNEQNYIQNLAVGSVQKNLYISVLEQLEIADRPLREQKAIADILSALDDKIELNNQINKNLEEMAQAIFKSWFIDFEPFQDGEFVESELGLIPKGWEVSSLDSVANYLNGLAMQKYRPTGDEFLPVIKIKELRQGFATSESDKATPDLDPRYIVENGDILFSWSGTLEVKIWSGGKGALNQHLFKVTSEKYDKWFYYYWTKHYLNKFRKIAEDKATTMGHIKRKDLNEAKVLIPDKATYKQINCLMEPIFNKLTLLDIQNKTLQNLRDTLLPKLMSGEIRVPLENEGRHQDEQLQRV
ncbi:type I restriction enzyme S subunit [Laceyella sacchari]|uniref:restriction endonuclease subunit S n=1 Tax=Laceyella sacchari TaxID=37482 RepID=UPI00104DA750|nr:restriction endonuclease subunit S [Laceyella sacchari]TCW40969.1 type I restriction enzyme S subunit [Laceyella sacchari]